MKPISFILILLIPLFISAQKKEMTLQLASNIEVAPFGLTFTRGDSINGWFLSHKMTAEFLTRTVIASDQYYNHLIREMNEIVSTAGYYRFITPHTGFYVGGGFLHGPAYFKGNDGWVYCDYGPLVPTLTFGAYFRINDWRFMTGLDYFFFMNDEKTRKATFTLSVGGII